MGATGYTRREGSAEAARRPLSETHGGDEGVVARAFELVDIEEVERLTEADRARLFTPSEQAYARAHADPARRLAARLAAKRAACRLLGAGTGERDVEVTRDAHGPPRLELSAPARARLAARGAGTTLVSLTHERRQAAAVVLLLRGER
jgi:holo-[acyl-carrier protein] synthase